MDVFPVTGGLTWNFQARPCKCEREVPPTKKCDVTVQTYQTRSFRSHKKKVWGAVSVTLKHNEKSSGKAWVVQEEWVRVRVVYREFNIIYWNQLMIFPGRVSGEIKKKTQKQHTVNFTWTYLVCKNEIRVCVVMLW